MGDLYRLAGVTVTTCEGTAVKCGRRRLVMDTAQAFGESLPVAELPPVPDRGGEFEWRDLVAALRALV